MRQFADDRRDRPGHRRLRRGRLGAAAAAGPGGLAGGGAGRRTVLGSGHRLGQRRGGLAPPVLDRPAGDRGLRPGADGLEQLRPRRRRLDGPLRGLHPAFSPERLRHATPRRGRRRLAAELPRPAPVLRRHRAGTAGGRRALAVGRSARLPAPAAPGRRERRDVPARRGQARDHRQGRPGGDRQRPVRQPAALHLPRLLPAGLQGQRQGIAADHARPRRAGARRRGARRRDGHPGRRRRAHRPGDGRALRQRRPGAVPAGPDGGGRRVLDRDAPAAAELGVQPVPRRPVQRLRPGRPLPHGPGRAADRGPLRRRSADVQGAAARGEHRGVLRDRSRPRTTSAGSRSRPSRRCRSPGPSTSPRRGTGVRRCAST
jgi:hypothetical protein